MATITVGRLQTEITLLPLVHCEELFIAVVKMHRRNPSCGNVNGKRDQPPEHLSCTEPPTLADWTAVGPSPRCPSLPDPECCGSLPRHKVSAHYHRRPNNSSRCHCHRRTVYVKELWASALKRKQVPPLLVGPEEQVSARERNCGTHSARGPLGTPFPTPATLNPRTNLRTTLPPHLRRVDKRC